MSTYVYSLNEFMLFGEIVDYQKPQQQAWETFFQVVGQESVNHIDVILGWLLETESKSLLLKTPCKTSGNTGGSDLKKPPPWAMVFTVPESTMQTGEGGNHSPGLPSHGPVSHNNNLHGKIPKGDSGTNSAGVGGNQQLPHWIEGPFNRRAVMPTLQT